MTYLIMGWKNDQGMPFFWKGMVDDKRYTTKIRHAKHFGSLQQAFDELACEDVPNVMARGIVREKAKIVAYNEATGLIRET